MVKMGQNRPSTIGYMVAMARDRPPISKIRGPSNFFLTLFIGYMVYQLVTWFNNWLDGLSIGYMVYPTNCFKISLIWLHGLSLIHSLS